MAEALPAGISARQLNEALTRFRKIVGDSWVFSGEKAQSYHDPYPVADDTQSHRASAAVAPASTEEVQQIAKIANDLRIPLWVVSRGKNFAYGGAAPVLAGSVVLDLSRMNRILEVS